MKMLLLSDNTDMLLGMRLAGVEGVYIENIHDFPDALQKVISDKEIAILLITHNLSRKFEDIINPIKMNEQPLIISI